MQPEADLVRHRAGGDEQRRLLAQQLGHPLCEPMHRGVFVKTSSPTSAAAMAARIPAVGRVTVSLRKSMGGREWSMISHVLAFR